MHRIDGPGATVDNKFTEGDPVSAVPATQVTDDWLNAVQEEITAVILSAGITLNKANNAQLLAAITQKIASAIPASPPDASTTVKGLIELATGPEVQDGTDNLRAVTPAGLKAAYGLGDSVLVTDLNNAATGYFYAAPGATNSPGSGIVLGETRGAGGTAGKSQSCIDISTRVAYKRAYNGGTWSAWSSFIDSATLATETVTGVAKVATQPLTNAGVDDATIVTPKKLRNGFSAVLSANGYIAFPTWLGGLIIQWGVGVVTTTLTGGTAVVSLPTVFQSNHFGGVCNKSGTAVLGDSLCPYYSNTSLSTGTLVLDAATGSTGATGAQNVFYICWGN